MTDVWDFIKSAYNLGDSGAGDKKPSKDDIRFHEYVCTLAEKDERANP